MAPLVRIPPLVVTACLIAVPSAMAGNAEDPAGLLKKTTDQVAAPAPTAPTAETQQGNGQSGSQNTKTPTTNAQEKAKGLAKKAPAATTQTAPVTTTKSTTRKRTSSTRRSSTTTSRRTARRSTGSGSNRRAANRASGGSSGAAAADRSREAASDAAAALTRRKAEARKAKPAAKAKPKPTRSAKKKPSKGVTRLTNAAENVVEVIPGALILALTGLIGLVVLLTFRSWVYERRRRRALTDSYGKTVQALAIAIEAKDHTTGGHIERVRDIGLLLASKIVPREASDSQMAYGFLLHDIGKLAVPDSILRKPGRLDGDEWAKMRKHPDEGVRILGSIPFLDGALDVVRYHHERWDGTGYPEGLAGEEIPLWARIFSVVDALDAITADRPYRARASYSLALEEIRRNAGTQFDPAVVDALEALPPSEVERLLEPAQLSDRQDDAEVAGLEPIEAMLAAAELAREGSSNGDGAHHDRVLSG